MYLSRHVREIETKSQTEYAVITLFPDLSNVVFLAFSGFPQKNLVDLRRIESSIVCPRDSGALNISILLDLA